MASPLEPRGAGQKPRLVVGESASMGWDDLAANFFHVDCAVTPQRLYCLFAIKMGNRYVGILGITATPGRSLNRASRSATF